MSRETLVSAALELIDDVGVDKLTARKLAQQLDSSPMALYWHFRNMDELLAAVGDHLAESVEPVDSAPSRTTWDLRLGSALDRVIDVAERHPLATDLLVKRLLFTPNGQAVAEQALSAMLDAGLDQQTAVIVARHSLRVAVNVGTEALFIGRAGKESNREDGLTFDAEAHPGLATTSPLLHQPTSARAYRETAVQLIISGVREMAKH